LSLDLNRCYIALVHIPRKTHMLIPIGLVYKDIVTRAYADRRDMRWNFDVKVQGYRKYAIKGTGYLGEIPIPFVATLDPLWRLLSTPLDIASG
jgi:hypothetical protein